MTPSVSERLKALEEQIATQDHGRPAAYGTWYVAVKLIRAEIESVAKGMRRLWGIEQGSLTVAEFRRFDELADRLAKEGEK